MKDRSATAPTDPGVAEPRTSGPSQKSVGRMPGCSGGRRYRCAARALLRQFPPESLTTEIGPERLSVSVDPKPLKRQIAREVVILDRAWPDKPDSNGSERGAIAVTTGNLLTGQHRRSYWGKPATHGRPCSNSGAGRRCRSAPKMSFLAPRAETSGWASSLGLRMPGAGGSSWRHRSPGSNSIRTIVNWFISGNVLMLLAHTNDPGGEIRT